MVGLLLFLGGVVMFLFLPFLVLMLLLRLRFHVVREEERLVVYRTGRFQRIAGPGIVWVAHGFEKIERILDVREQPHDIPVGNLFFFDIPFGYTLNLWYRLDPVAAANGDRAQLHRLAQMPLQEVNEQIHLAVRNLMETYLVEMPRRYSFSGNPSLIEKLLPLLPGQDGYDWLLDRLKQDLPAALRPFGVMVYAGRPILLKSLYLAPEVIKLFNRARTVQVLREQQPALSEDALMHLVMAFENTPLHSVRKFTLDNGKLYMDGMEFGDSEGKIQMAAERYQRRSERSAQEAAEQAGHRNIPQEQRRTRSTSTMLP